LYLTTTACRGLWFYLEIKISEYRGRLFRIIEEYTSSYGITLSTDNIPRNEAPNQFLHEIS